jgi:PAS domain S-box-containing protein
LSPAAGGDIMAPMAEDGEDPQAMDSGGGSPEGALDSGDRSHWETLESGDPSRWEALEATLPLVYVAELDRAGTIRYISEVVRQWTGYAPADFLADPQLWYSCIHPDDVARVRYAEQQFFDSREQLNLEYRIVGPDGEPRWVWERNTIVRDGRGAPICTHGTILASAPGSWMMSALTRVQHCCCARASSPAYPHGRSCTSTSAWRSPAPSVTAPPWRCSTSTSTASAASTMPSATSAATLSWRRWRGACVTAFPPVTCCCTVVPMSSW